MTGSLRTRAMLGAAGALLCVACTSDLSVTPAKGLATPLEGYPYRLKFTQFDIAVSWRITECSGADGKLKVKIAADVKPKTAFDAEHFFILDPRPLYGLFRTGDFSLEWYEDRQLKTINLSADDQTGPAIGGLMGGLVKLASVGFGAPGSTTPKADDKCPKAVRDALNKLEDDKKKVGAKQAEVDAATRDVARHTAKATLLGAAVDRERKAALANAVDALTRRTEELGDAQAALQLTLQPITASAKTVWPRTSNEFVLEDEFKLPAKAQADWDLTSANARLLDVHALLAPVEKLGPSTAVAQLFRSCLSSAPPRADLARHRYRAGDRTRHVISF